MSKENWVIVEVKEAWNVVFNQNCILSDRPVYGGIVVMHNLTACAPLLRLISVHSIAEAMQGCFVEFCIDTLSSEDLFMMNQHINVKEHN